MHEHIGSFKHNQTQKFHKNLINFKKPQKPRSKCMKCMIKDRKEIIIDEEHKIWAKKQVGKVKRLSEKCLGERKECFCRDKSERNEKKIALKLYIETRILMDRRAVEH